MSEENRAALRVSRSNAIHSIYQPRRKRRLLSGFALGLLAGPAIIGYLIAMAYMLKATQPLWEGALR